MKTIKTLLTAVLALACVGLLAQSYEIYVSDAGNFDQPPWQILKYDQHGENPQVFINTNLAWPQDIVFLEDQNEVLISNLNTGQIAKFNATTGAFIEDFATGIGGPTRMKIGADTLLYVLQWSGNGKVFRYELDGTFVDEFTELGLTTSIGMDWDSEGNLYVSSYSQNLVRKYGPAGEDLGVFANTNLLGPTNIWFGENGHLFALNWGGFSVSEFDADGLFVQSFIPNGLGQAEGVSFLENGDLLIGNGADATVKLYDSTGDFKENLVPSGLGGLLQPNAVVLRAVPPSATQEVAESYQFFAPNKGVEFILDQETAKDLKQIEFYNSEGKLIDQLNPGQDRLWQAGRHPNGVYFAHGHHKDGKTYLQKLVVQQ